MADTPTSQLREKLAAAASKVAGFARAHWPAVSRSVYFVPAVGFVVGMAAFALSRVMMLLVYPDYFADLTYGEVLYAFYKGALLDASILLTFTALPSLLMTLPFRWSVSQWFRMPAGWLICAITIVMAFVLGGDVVYFDEVNRHAGPETWAVGNDFRILLAYAFGEYLLPLLLVFAAFGGLCYGCYRLLRIRVEQPKNKRRAGLITFGLFLLTFLAIRGSVTRKPLNVVNAFDGVSLQTGNLILTGPFSLGHSLQHASYYEVEHFPIEEAREMLLAPLASPRDKRTDDDAYPLLRHRSCPSKGKPNVVIVLLESWSAVRVDAIRKAHGLEPLGATPCFDKLCEEGVLYSRFYAAGQRSIQGIMAILAGFPTLPGQPYLGVGLEQNAFPYLGWYAKELGYSSYFMQGSPRSSYRCDAISSMAGFDVYYGEEDYEVSDHSDHPHDPGAWDYDLFVKAADTFKSAPKPFLGFVFTLSTHGPFEVPDPKFKKFPDEKAERGYLNSLVYSDWALGQFFEWAKRDGFYDNTVFIVVADHTRRCPEFAKDESKWFWIPLLIIAPGLKPGVNDALGSQLDMLPTIMDLAGWSGWHSTVGRSLLETDNADTRFVLSAKGEMAMRIENKGWVMHDLMARRDSSKEPGARALDAIEKRLLGSVQALTVALRENRVYKPMSGVTGNGDNHGATEDTE